MLMLGMTKPLFQTGDLVRIQALMSTVPAECLLDDLRDSRPDGAVEVTAVLPVDDAGRRQYRLKGGEPPHERMAYESQLVHASKPQPRS